MTQPGCIVIVGLGKTGLSCARFLADQKQAFAVIDSRLHPPELDEFYQDDCSHKAVDIVTGHFSNDLLSQARAIVLSPGISLKHPSIAPHLARGIPVIGDIELFAREVRQPVVAITGSNGKTTVTTLVGRMMQKAGYNTAVCGNIGEPVLPLLRAEGVERYVLELSSFQLETTFSLSAQVATVLNISPDHMDRYAHFQAYAAAKQRIYQRCKAAVINLDDPHSCTGMPPEASVVSFGWSKGADFSVRSVCNKTAIVYQEEPCLFATELKVQAKHSLQNAMAALAIGHASGLSIALMLPVLREFSGIRHRCQWVRQCQGVDYYNDSKGTNVAATVMAIESLGEVTGGQIVLIAGGQSKGADFTPLKKVLKTYVKMVILIGEDTRSLQETVYTTASMKSAKSMEAAVLLASQSAEEGDGVLLSPACASFDWFAHFEERGDHFIAAVEALSAE